MLKKQVSLITKDASAVMQKAASFQMNFVEFKAMEDGKIRIKGFASTPDVDRYDDIVNPAAFANAMQQYMSNPVVLLGHCTEKAIGLVLEYNLSTAGLEITAELSNDIDNTFQNIQNKVLRGFSIGFICKAANYREENGGREIREITELDLVEISVVATPANASSLFTLAKSLKNMFGEVAKKDAEEAIEAEVAPVVVEEEKPEEIKEEEETDEEKAKKAKKKEECEDDIEEAAKKEAEVEAKEEEAKPEPKTEEEAPAGEIPATPAEAADASAPGKSDVVEADEKPEEIPQGITEDEVKALTEIAIKSATDPLLATIDEQKKAFEALQSAFTDIAKSFGDLKQNHEALEVSHKKVEADMLKIVVKPGTFAGTGSKHFQSHTITDAMVLKSIGA